MSNKWEQLVKSRNWEQWDEMTESDQQKYEDQLRDFQKYAPDKCNIDSDGDVTISNIYALENDEYEFLEFRECRAKYQIFDMRKKLAKRCSIPIPKNYVFEICKQHGAFCGIDMNGWVCCHYGCVIYTK